MRPAAISPEPISTTVWIPAGDTTLEGELIAPSGATGVVLFAHGSGSSRHSPRNRYVAEVIRDGGMGTLLFDLLTRDEEAVDNYTRRLRFDISLLAARLTAAAEWVVEEYLAKAFNVGFFGASTGAGAALVSAANLGDKIRAVVSRGGRPDLAGGSLPLVKAPVLLIVGGLDHVVIELNQEAYAKLTCEKELKIVPGATHLFEEAGTLKTVALLASDWFSRFL